MRVVTDGEEIRVLRRDEVEKYETEFRRMREMDLGSRLESSSFLSTGNVGFKLSEEKKFEGCVQYRSGPKPRSSSSPHDAIQTIPGPTQSSAGSNDAGTYDQCVFLPMYRIKYRILPFHLFPRRIEAAAGYDNLGGPEDDNANAPAPMIVTERGEEDEADVGADNVSVIASFSSSRTDESLLGSWSS